MKITYSKRFSKQFAKVPVKIQEQFFARLELFVEDSAHPTLKVHKLVAQYAGHFSFNVNADIRVVFFEISDGAIQLIAIGSHSELYE